MGTATGGFPGAFPGGGGGGPPAVGGTTNGGANAVPPGTPGTINLDGSPKYYSFIRLTNAQWARAVQDVLRLDAPSGLERDLQDPVVGTTDFSNNELLLDVNQASWASYQSAAEALATQVTASDAALARVYAGTDAPGFIRTVGRRVYRRPLTTAEEDRYQTLFSRGASLQGSRTAFAKGASLVLRAMLQSPFFLYRTELGAKGAPLSGYEIAARLSLWLRGTTPSDTLLDDAARPGTLDTADGAANAATAMLGEPAALEVMRDFHGELYHFDLYAQISKVNVPGYDTALNTELAELSVRFVDRLFSQNLGLREILTSTTGFVGPRTATLYGVAPVNGYAEMDLGPRRAGYFSQLPFLVLHALNAEPDSIHRGVSINLDVLCAKLGPPAIELPPIPPLQPGQTNRQRIDTLTAGCGAKCHNEMINPLGFSFEHYDGMGQYRDAENGGLPIDSSGQYAFSSGTKRFADSGELMRAMANDSQAHVCYAKKLASFGLQRDIVAADRPLLDSLAQVSAAADGSTRKVVLKLVQSDAFRTRAGGN